MRLALQALFTTTGANEEGAARRASLERKLRADERSAGFFRRLRAAADDSTLGAPEIFAEESFPDANVVAEYLDGQADPELARAYEDACWDSPEMLAEIGCCCDILNNDALNMVVVPKNCRRRLYYIAWEESAIDVSSEKEPPTLTTKLAASDVCVEQDETEAREAIDSNEAENAKTLPVKRMKRTRAKGKKAESVRSTLEAERSWRRRGKRLSSRLALALGLLAVGYCGWQTLRERPSETLQLRTANSGVERNDSLDVSLETAEAATSLCPTTISTSNFDEIPTISLAETPQTALSEASDDLTNVATEENDPPKLAALPNLTDDATNWETSEPNAERRRVGLGGDEPWQSRPAIQIPTQNNDVFMKTQLY